MDIANSTTLGAPAVSWYEFAEVVSQAEDEHHG